MNDDKNNPNVGHAQENEDHSEVIDIEKYAKEGKTPPVGKKYRIRIDKDYFEVETNHMTGKEILELAKKNPDRFRLDQKLKGGATKKIELTDTVDFTEPGVERFMTLPLDQTEG